MNLRTFTAAITSSPNGRVIALIDTGDQVLVLPDTALSWRRAAMLERDGAALLGVYGRTPGVSATLAYEYMAQDRDYLLRDDAVAEEAVA